MTVTDINQYTQAYQICNSMIKKAEGMILPGSTVGNICSLIDQLLLLEAMNNKKFQISIFYPCSITVNNQVQNCSSNGAINFIEFDLVKIEMGIQVNGFKIKLAHTKVINPTPQLPIQGSQADIICASYLASKALSKIFAQNIRGILSETAKYFNVYPLMNQVCYQVESKYPQFIWSKQSDKNIDEYKVANDQLWIVNVLMCTHDVDIVEKRDRASIFTVNYTSPYQLKLKTSRQLLGFAKKTFGKESFGIGSITDDKLKLGIRECYERKVFNEVPLTSVSKDCFVSQFQFSVYVTENSNVVFACDSPPPYVHSQYSISKESFLTPLIN